MVSTMTSVIEEMTKTIYLQYTNANQQLFHKTDNNMNTIIDRVKEITI